MIIGLEVELHSDSVNVDYLLNNCGFSLTEFKPIAEGLDIGVRLSREYYESTIEFNFTPFENTKKNLDCVSKYLEGIMNKFNLSVSCEGPAFVGTHVHLFDNDRLNTRISSLLKNVLGFISNNLEGINDTSFNRLLLAHQLWGNYSWRNLHKWKDYLCNNNLSPAIYDNTRDKPKYNPIIYSRANSETGKPPSLEIRIIPNEYVFNGKLYSLLKEVEKRKFSHNINDIGFWESILPRIKKKSDVSGSDFMDILSRKQVDEIFLSLYKIWKTNPNEIRALISETYDTRNIRICRYLLDKSGIDYYIYNRQLEDSINSTISIDKLNELFYNINGDGESNNNLGVNREVTSTGYEFTAFYIDDSNVQESMSSGDTTNYPF